MFCFLVPHSTVAIDPISPLQGKRKLRKRVVLVDEITLPPEYNTIANLALFKDTCLYTYLYVELYLRRLCLPLLIGCNIKTSECGDCDTCDATGCGEDGTKKGTRERWLVCGRDDQELEGSRKTESCTATCTMACSK